MINFKINTSKNFHDDFSISFNNSAININCDLYYFLINLKEEEKPSLYSYLSKYIDRQIQKLEALNPGDELYFPIQIYDESTGFIYIQKFGSNKFCNIYFCTFQIEGWSFNPWKDEFKSLNKNDILSINGALICSQEEIIDSLNKFTNDIAMLKLN